MMYPTELLSAYLDGELSRAEQLRVVAHLESCTACRMDLADLQSARAAVRALPILDAPDWLRPSEPAALELARRHPAASFATAAAAILALAIGLASWFAPPPEVELQIADIAATHGARAVQDGIPASGGMAEMATLLPGVVAE